MSDKRVATIYDYARFLKEVCHKTPRCNDCPLGGNNNGIGVTCSNLIKQYTDTYNDIILKWCDEHPQKTRQSELLKLFPKARIEDDVIGLCPDEFVNGFAYNVDCDAMSGAECTECRKRFWLEEVE